MKKISFILLIVLMPFSMIAEDVLILKNNMKFQGEVLKVKKHRVIFSVGEYRYQIPANDVLGICFESENNEVYLKLLELQVGPEIKDPEKCAKAQMDVEAFHGKGFGNFALGFFFGVFGLIGCAVSSPGPENGAHTIMLSKNKELFTDPSYLYCYKKKARGKAVGNAAFGWAAAILFIVVIAAS